MSSIKDKLFKVLRDRPQVITRATFWKIPHNNSEDEIALKVGRYKKTLSWREKEEPECLEPKSKLTFDNEEFVSLVAFLQENYEPFKQGVKAYIPLDKPFERSNAEQIKAFFSLPDKSRLVKFLLSNDVIPEELELGIQLAKRLKAIEECEQMLQQDLVESIWQTWFVKNSWILGSEFVRVLDERNVDTTNITDFLVEAYDGFLDIIEIKRPTGSLTFWAKSTDHGNYYPSSDLTKAITQSLAYIYAVERESNSIKFLIEQKA